MFLDDITGPMSVKEAKMSAAMKLQRAFQREQEKSEASRRRGEEVMANAKADFEKKTQEKQVNELSPATLKSYARANVDNQVQRASSDSFKSGAKGDKYNKADTTHKDTMRQHGMDRALNKLSGVKEDSWYDGQNAWSSDKHEMVEAGNPAQQAAIAIAKKKEQGVAEAEGRVDPILIKALNRMPDGLATHGEVLNACYDAYAMELGRMEMKSNYGTTHAYIPQLMDLYKEKHGLTFNEEYTPAPAKPFRNPPGFNKQGTGIGNKLAQQTRAELAKKKEQGVAEGHADQQRKVFKKNGKPVGEVGIDRESSPGNGQWYMKCYASNIDNAGYDSYEEAVAELKHCLKQGVAEDTGSWIVYDPATKQIKKRFKTHTAGKSYAQTHGLGFASSEYYFDRVKGQEAVAEAETDFSKRRQRERDVDAGKPVRRQAKNPQTDYARKRAKEKRDLERFGESTNYWTKLQDKRNTKLNSLVNELKESVK